MDVAGRTRARNDIVRIVHRGLDLPTLATALHHALERVVPFEGSCLLTFDPATMLPTGEVVENALGRDAVPRLMEIEQREPDYNKFTALARGRRHRAASLSAATRGDLEQSVRQRELRRPAGFDDELRLACSDATGTWGALTLLRESKRPHFAPVEVGFLASIADVLADGLRRAALLGEVAGSDGSEAGVLVLAADNTVEMTDRQAERWLDQLAAARTTRAELPIVVLAVAARARRAASDHATDSDRDPAPAGVARARVRIADGRWVLVRGSLLGDAPASRVAVLLEAARPAELAPLIADALGLTGRERRVTELVARGFSTNDIAARLHIAAYTVQDHLKSIFDKTGTGSRGDLVARLFFDHYAPRLSAAADEQRDESTADTVRAGDDRVDPSTSG